jgi:hypothetical protein
LGAEYLTCCLRRQIDSGALQRGYHIAAIGEDNLLLKASLPRSRWPMKLIIDRE